MINIIIGLIVLKVIHSKMKKGKPKNDEFGNMYFRRYEKGIIVTRVITSRSDNDTVMGQYLYNIRKEGYTNHENDVNHNGDKHYILIKDDRGLMISTTGIKRSIQIVSYYKDKYNFDLVEKLSHTINLDIKKYMNRNI